MSKNPNSQDIAKQTTDQLGQIAKSAVKNKRSRRLAAKGFKAAAKFLKFFMQKFIPMIIKTVGSYIGSYALIIILLMVLLFIVMDSVADFDFFGKGGERNKAEVLFDNTIKEVVVDRTQQLADPLVDQLQSQQSSHPYPPVNEAFLEEIRTKLVPSWALTATLYNYKNLKRKSYKAWHEEYRDTPMDTEDDREKAQEKFYEVINEAYDYYFTHPSVNLKINMGKSSGEKKDVREEISCTYESTSTDPDTGEETSSSYTETSTNQFTEDLPARDVVTDASIVYSSAAFTYSLVTGEYEHVGSRSEGNCTIEVYHKYTLYLLDDQGTVPITYSAEALLYFLMVDNPEGELARLVKARDVEYVLETASHIDDNFPKVGVNYEKLIACAIYKPDVSSCISSSITSGLFSGSGLAGWYPESLKELYEMAAQAYGIDWWILASVHAQETTFSANPVASNPSKSSPAGAKGHFQFMLRTWIGWNFKGSSTMKVTSNGHITGPLDGIIAFITNPATISKYGGYGVDANANGLASPWEIEDAVFSAANYLKASGYVIGNEAQIRKAIGAYNHSTAYVNEVYNRGLTFQNGAAIGGGHLIIGDGTGGGNVSVVEVGKKWIGNSDYVFGGGRNPNDIKRGIFDCSSFVHWAFKQVGIDLGPLTSTSTETLKNKGKAVSTSEMQPGDIVFFNTYKKDGHVGIYVGDGKFIGCQGSTGVAIADMSKGYWKEKFNGRVKRI
ncbi:NlpC/P60 family protein [Metabacillus fastidiosus]|uniref:C40 family peptidase n=1 Tax=Metabacillus fastidiosus TaxID=1458 RepID=UPI003D2D6194